MTERLGVAIVGGGPAGAALAARLAAVGQPVVVLERSAHWQWRAGGVFASPAAVSALRRIGSDAALLREVARPIPAMRVETPGRRDLPPDLRRGRRGRTGGRVRPVEAGPVAARAGRGCAGAEIRRGWSVTAVDLDDGALTVRRPDGTPTTLAAAVIVGADGPHSVVAKAAGVARPARLDPRIGLTYHLPDPAPGAPRDARMRLLRDGYVGIAPVAGGRVNIGIVLGRSWRVALARDGARSVADAIVAAIPPTDEDPARWRQLPPTDELAGAWPLGHRVTRRAGRRWLLVGDAAGFLDPFTGEGIHRALVSAELAASRDLRPRSWPDRCLRRLRARDAASVPRQGRRCRGSSRRSSGGHRCSSTRPGASPPARRFVRRWVS